MTAETGLERLPVLVHELRSPVAALAAISTVYARSADPSERRSLAGLVLAACRGIERVVGDAAVSSIRVEEVDLARLVRDAASAASLHGADVRAVVADDVAPVEADPVRLRQAVDNLVANAIRHAPGESVALAVEPGEGFVEISVSDRGPGISERDQERIFEPGVRLVDGPAGSGLGLPLARAIAVAHGGTLTVTSVPGEGATFTLALPTRAGA
jgi:two-component system, OmpR family, sensor kinase